tara:strand:- start:43 stop:231 length:189 start_codon:yes stop_codon:yes gene_type:complete
MGDLLIVSAIFAGKVADSARDITATFAQSSRLAPYRGADSANANSAYLAAKCLNQAPLTPVT